ncbi:MAG TPA: hypothetical protein VH815_01660, partial [Acidobacteriota bacterium]
AGAALRSAERKAEEDIPVRPTKRIFASYITSLFYLIILGVILLLASKPFQYSLFLQQDYKVLFVALAVLPLHSAAFAFSYWLGQGLIGSVIAVISTAAPMYWLLVNNFSSSNCCESSIQNFLVVIAFYFFPSLIFRHLEWILIASVIMPAIITIVFNLLVLVWLVKRIEIEKQIWLPMKIAVAVFMISGFLIGFWFINYAGGIFALTGKDVYDLYYLGDYSDYVR